MDAWSRLGFLHMSISDHKHMPEPARRIEVFTRAGRRQSWSPGEKAEIIAESYVEDKTVCAVARRHRLTPQQLFTWRRQARGTRMAETPAFVPADAEVSAPGVTKRLRRRGSSTAASIELEIDGVVVRVGTGAQATRRKRPITQRRAAKSALPPIVYTLHPNH